MTRRCSRSASAATLFNTHVYTGGACGPLTLRVRCTMKANPLRFWTARELALLLRADIKDVSATMVWLVKAGFALQMLEANPNAGRHGARRAVWHFRLRMPADQGAAKVAA